MTRRRATPGRSATAVPATAASGPRAAPHSATDATPQAESQPEPQAEQRGAMAADVPPPPQDSPQDAPPQPPASIPSVVSRAKRVQPKEQDLPPQDSEDAPLPPREDKALAEPSTPRRARKSHRSLAVWIVVYNRRYALAGLGSDTVVLDIDLETGAVRRFYTIEQFKRARLKDRVHRPKDLPPIDVAPVWLRSPEGQAFDQLIFAPPGSAHVPGPRDYNTWRGLRIRAKPGTWAQVRTFLHDVVCDGDDGHFRWLLNWLAALVQQPGRQAWACVLLIGINGIGKTFFADVVVGGLFLPQHYAHLSSGDQLTGRFNDVLASKVLIVADEVAWSSPAAANKLKSLITESTLWIERKGLPIVSEISALHVILTSNNERPLRMEGHDRRFLVLQPSDRHRQDTPYFARLHAELEAGGWAAMLDELQHRHVDEDLLRHPPESRAKTQQKVDSLEPEETWWAEQLHAAGDGDWLEVRGTTDLHDRYRAWFHDRGIRRSVRNRIAFGNWFAAHFTAGGMPGWPREAKLPDPAQFGRRMHAKRFPSLDACVRVFEVATGVPVRPDAFAAGFAPKTGGGPSPRPDTHAAGFAPKTGGTGGGPSPRPDTSAGSDTIPPQSPNKNTLVLCVPPIPPLKEMKEMREKERGRPGEKGTRTVRSSRSGRTGRGR